MREMPLMEFDDAMAMPEMAEGAPFEGDTSPQTTSVTRVRRCVCETLSVSSSNPNLSPNPNPNPVTYRLIVCVPTPRRSFFPEAWLWEAVDLDSTGAGSSATVAPDTITSWQLSAFGVAADAGVAVRNPNLSLTLALTL